MKTLSISEAREQFSAVVKLAKQGKDDVVIENRGRPEAVIISYSDYGVLQQAREDERVKMEIQALQRIADEVGSRNKDMSEEEADKLANEITREAIENMVNKGTVSFQK
jgi:prevent-host-death family protein